MIIEPSGSIFDSDAEALVNPVNCVGVMGKGLALEFKQWYPDYFADYRSKCRKGWIALGSINPLVNIWVDDRIKIISFPTKYHWRESSSLSAIESGLLDLISVIDFYKIKSIAIPALGCGLGQLDWSEVKPLIVQAFESQPDVQVFLYEPRTIG